MVLHIDLCLGGGYNDFGLSDFRRHDAVHKQLCGIVPHIP